MLQNETVKWWLMNYEWDNMTIITAVLTKRKGKIKAERNVWTIEKRGNDEGMNKWSLE